MPWFLFLQERKQSIPTDLFGMASHRICRTADLAQVRLAPPTCKRTPHCQDGKHGERRDDMAEGAAAWYSVYTLPTGKQWE
ncbi:hypothetical protein GW17_00033849 [Ensete ventricosum]|nr:hypothetical protein GW17_00033849 [Ensete ventricosum]